MKALVTGVKILKGISKAGKDFEMPYVFVLQPVEVFKRDKIECVGYGLEPAEPIPLDPACIEQFKPYADKFPVLLDLDTDAVARFGKFETLVTGVRKVAPVVKAA